MNTTRNLDSDKLQILLTNLISFLSTLVNFIGFYVIVVQKSKESRSFILAQLAYQVILYLSQMYAGTVLNIVFLFPIPGAYCIGWLRNLTGFPALLAFVTFAVLFASQGLFMVVIIVMKVGAIARNGSPFKLTPLAQKLFLTAFVTGGALAQAVLLFLTYSNRASIESFMKNEHPDMAFVLRYPFIWMLTTSRHFVALIFTSFISIGLVFMIFTLSYVILLVELDLQVKKMSKATNNYNRRVVHEIVGHSMISLPFLVGVPLTILMKFFFDESVDLSIPTTLSFALFTFAPIPSMLVLLFRNPVYRKFLRSMVRLKKATPQISMAVRVSNISVVEIH